jgi:hypothetical protein
MGRVGVSGEQSQPTGLDGEVKAGRQDMNHAHADRLIVADLFHRERRQGGEQFGQMAFHVRRGVGDDHHGGL